MSREDLLKGLSPEQIEKIHNCKTQDELLNLAKAEGVELSEEQLEVVSGGGCGHFKNCPVCGSEDVCLAPGRQGHDTGTTLYYCRECESYFSYEDVAR